MPACLLSIIGSLALLLAFVGAGQMSAGSGHQSGWSQLLASSFLPHADIVCEECDESGKSARRRSSGIRSRQASSDTAQVRETRRNVGVALLHRATHRLDNAMPWHSDAVAVDVPMPLLLVESSTALGERRESESSGAFLLNQLISYSEVHPC